MQVELLEQIIAVLSDAPEERSSISAPGLGVGSLKGPIRSENQDRAAVALLKRKDGEHLLIGIVCDGLGGMLRGSDAAVWAAASFLTSLAFAEKVGFKELDQAARSADSYVFKNLRGRGGATLAAFVFQAGGGAWAVHAGDSRLYTFDRVQGLAPFSTDDTLSGILKKNTNASPNIDNKLLQFVGIGDDIDPHISPIDIRPNSTFLITSDGAHILGNYIIEGVVKNSKDANDIVKKVCFICDAIGAPDNASIVALRVSDIIKPEYVGSDLSISIWTSSHLTKILFNLGIESKNLKANINNPKETKIRQSTARQVKSVRSKKTRSAGPNLRPEKIQFKISFDESE